MKALDIIRGETRRLASLATSTIRKVVWARCDGDGWSQWEGYQGELFDDVELIQQYGFASRPTAGEALIARGITGESAVAFATVDRDKRPDDMEADEVRVYGTDNNAARMRSDGSVDLDCKSGKTVNVGGSTDYLLKGTKFDAGYSVYLTAMVAAGSTWTGSAKLLPDVVTYVTAAVAAMTVLNAAHATGWLASKGKVT